MFTRHDDVRVMVIDTKAILCTSSQADLEKAVRPTLCPGECEKSRVVCAISSPDHFDIGVVHTSNGIRAIFQEGDEWQEALSLILSFIKARSPKTFQDKRVPRCPRWAPSDQGDCDCGETSCICIA